MSLLIFVEDYKRQVDIYIFDGLKFLNNHFEIKFTNCYFFFFFFLSTYSHANNSSCFIIQLYDVTIIFDPFIFKLICDAHSNIEFS